MIFETGDNFIVTRGRQYNTFPMFSPFSFDESWKQPAETKALYDKSYQGFVFEVLAFEANNVVGRVVAAGRPNDYFLKVGSKVIFNLDDVVIETVSKAFVEACR